MDLFTVHGAMGLMAGDTRGEVLTGGHRFRAAICALRAMALATLATAGVMTAAIPCTALAQRGPAAAPAEPVKVVVIRAARLIDGRGGEQLAPAMMRIDGDRITAVASSLPVPAGAREIVLGDD